MKEVREQLLEQGFKNNMGSCYYEYNGNTPDGDKLRIGIHIRNWNWYSFSATRQRTYEWKQKSVIERCVLNLSLNELFMMMAHFGFSVMY